MKHKFLHSSSLGYTGCAPVWAYAPVNFWIFLTSDIILSSKVQETARNHTAKYSKRGLFHFIFFVVRFGLALACAAEDTCVIIVFDGLLARLFALNVGVPFNRDKYPDGCRFKQDYSM